MNKIKIEGVSGAFAFERWHTGTGTRLYVYNGAGNACYFVDDAKNDDLWIAAFGIVENSGTITLRQGGAVAEFTRTKNHVVVAAYDPDSPVRPRSIIIARFTPDQAAEIQEVING